MFIKTYNEDDRIDGLIDSEIIHRYWIKELFAPEEAPESSAEPYGYRIIAYVDRVGHYTISQTYETRAEVESALVEQEFLKCSKTERTIDGNYPIVKTPSDLEIARMAIDFYDERDSCTLSNNFEPIYDEEYYESLYDEQGRLVR